jgi:hypothetical protein
MLSTVYEIGEDDRGRSDVELKQIAAEIEAGRGHSFDPNEEANVIAYAREVLSIPQSRLIKDVSWWLLPPLTVLALLWALLLMR